MQLSMARVLETGETLNVNQLMAVRLDDGKVTELTDIMYKQSEYSGMGLEAVTEDAAVYYVETYDPELTTYEEYVSEHPSEEDPYGSYTSYIAGETFGKQPGIRARYFIFRPETDEAEVLYEAQEEYKEYLGPGYLNAVRPIFFFGTYQGQWIINYREGEGAESTYALWDPETGARTVLARDKELGDGPVMSGAYNEKEMLWVRSLSGQGTQIYLHDMETGEERTLYQWKEGENHDWLEVLGQTDEYLVGRMSGFGGLTRYCVVSKKDFEESYLDKAKTMFIQ